MTDITMDVDTKALRQRILTLAIQGKLTDQRKEDGTAQDLYNQIQEEKKRLIKEKKIKKTKKLPEITEDEIPFDIPENWMWARLGDIFQVNPRNHVENENIDVSFLPMASIDEGYGSNYHPEIRKWKEVKKGFTHFANNDVVLAKISPCFQNLKSAFIHDLVNGIGAGTTELHVLRMFANTIDAQYLLYFVQNPGLINAGVKTFKGVVGQQRISTDFIKEHLIPLPPLAEQKRIAEKVSSLFVQLDAIDKAYEEYRELQQTMKSRLLEQAIQGKLTDQRKEDGNAQDLYNQIQEEKQRLIKEKKIKKAKPLPAITEEEKRFELPQSWKWCKIDDLAFVTKLAGFEYTEYIQPNLQQNGVPLIKGKNVQNGEIVWSFESYIPEKISDELFRSQLSKKCLLTPYVGTIGNIAIFDAHIKAHLGSNVGKIELFNNTEQHVLEEYVFYYLKSPIGLSELQKHKKSTAQASISIQAIRDVNIPLPPLVEQKRIVEKLDKLLPLCEA